MKNGPQRRGAHDYNLHADRWRSSRPRLRPRISWGGRRGRLVEIIGTVPSDSELKRQPDDPDGPNRTEFDTLLSCSLSFL